MRNTSALASLLLILGISSAHAQGASPLLDDPRGATRAPAHAATGQVRQVTINRGALGQREFLLDLFGESLLVTRDRIDNFGAGNKSWIGHIDGEPDSQVIISLRRNQISGTIHRAGLSYELSANELGESILYQVDRQNLPPLEPAQLPDGGHRPPVSQSSSSQSASPASRQPKQNNDLSAADQGDSTDNGFGQTTQSGTSASVTHDILVVYTQAACDQRGGCNTLEADIQNAVADTNQAYLNSGVDLSLNLADLRLSAYQESNSITQSLYHLTRHGGHAQDPNGELDEAHAWRDAVHADLTVLISDDANYCGVGWVNASAETAFSVVRWSCLSSRSFAHELGHNQGNAHNRADASVLGTYDYSHGHRDCTASTPFRTIMAYDGGCGVPRVNHFSNPAIDYQGTPTGIDISQADSADNAQSMNQTAPWVAGFRQASGGALQISPIGDQTSAPGDNVSLAIQANGGSGSYSFSAQGLPAGLAIDSTTGLISGTVAQQGLGSYPVSVSVSDGSVAVSQSFNWQIAEDSGGNSNPISVDGTCTNGAFGFIYYASYTVIYIKDGCTTVPTPPTIDPTGDQAALVGASANIQIAANDPNGEAMTFAATGLPTGLSIDPQTGHIGGTPAAGTQGTYSISVTATDSGGMVSNTDIFNLNVHDLSAPTELVHIWIDDQQPDRSFKLQWRHNASDLGDPLKTPAYYRVKVGTSPNVELSTVDFAASVGDRIWQSPAIDPDSQTETNTYFVASCVGDDYCTDPATVNIAQDNAGHDYVQITSLNLTWENQAVGTFRLDWKYPVDFFNSSTGKPEYFEIVPALDQTSGANMPATISVANTIGTRHWQSEILDDDDFLGTTYIVRACSVDKGCAEGASKTLSRTVVDPAMPVVSGLSAWVASTDDAEIRLQWSPSSAGHVDYYEITEDTANHNKVYFTEDSSVLIQRATGGDFNFWVRACERNREAGIDDRCGNYSSDSVTGVQPDYSLLQVSDLRWVDQLGVTPELRWDYDTSALDNPATRPSYFKVYCQSQGSGIYDDCRNNLGDENDGPFHVAVENSYAPGKWKSPGLIYGARNHTWRVEACVDTGQGVECGSPQSINLATTQSVSSDEPPPPAADNVVGGPDDLRPGEWDNPDYPYQGWTFYWASDLRYPSINEQYGETYDLIGYWWSYLLIDNKWQPVWYVARMKEIDNTATGSETSAFAHFMGDLMFVKDTGSGRELVNVGHVAVAFCENEQQTNCASDPQNPTPLNHRATINISMDRAGGMEGETNLSYGLSYFGDNDSLFGVHNLGTEENPIDHYAGMWWDSQNAELTTDFAVVPWMDRRFESHIVAFFDNNGMPVWARADRPLSEPMAPAGEASPDFDFLIVTSGFDPAVEQPGVTKDDLIFKWVGPGNRIYHQSGDEQFRSAQFRFDLNLDQSMSSDGSVRDAQLYTNGYTQLTKGANFHDVRFFVGDNLEAVTVCETGGGVSCDLSLNWFTDSLYPDATVYLRDTGTGSRTLVKKSDSPTHVGYPYTITTPGSYQFELWKYQGSESLTGNAMIADSAVLTVNQHTPNSSDPDVPPAPHSQAFPAADNVSASVGATAGEFRVDEQGMATYRIPILTAPGSGGVAPQLALAYSSQGGNGQLGVGWQLSGLSAIGRCSRTIEQDGIALPEGITMTSADRFCLDGQRLVLKSGVYGADASEYRLETDPYTRVIAYGSAGDGPAHFEVWRKDGSVSEYGKTSDSRIEGNLADDVDTTTVDESQTVYAWALNGFSDSASNYINFLYDESATGAGNPVEFTIDKIAYTGNAVAGTTPFAEIDFVYQTRPDPSDGFSAGVHMRNTKRLLRIDSKAEAMGASSLSFLRSYHLNYSVDGLGRSIIESLEECNNASRSVCYPPTLFDWQRGRNKPKGNPGDHNTANYIEYFPSVDNPVTTDYVQGQPVDINADGQQDLVFVAGSGNSHRLYYSLAYAGGVGAHQQIAVLPADMVPSGDEWNSREAAFGVTDYNLDGYVDVIYAGSDDRWKGHRWLGSGYSTIEDLGPMLPTAGAVNEWPEMLRILDFNGDGQADLFYSANGQLYVAKAQNGGPGSYYGTPVAINLDLGAVSNPDLVLGPYVTSHRKLQPFDYNGDGRVDLLVKVSAVYCPGGDITDCSTQGGPTPDEPIAADPVPASGYLYSPADVAELPPMDPDVAADGFQSYSYSAWHVLSAEGLGDYVTADIPAAGSNCSTAQFPQCAGKPQVSVDFSNAYTNDINADGLADFVYRNAGGWKFLLNSGAGLVCPYASCDIAAINLTDPDLSDHVRLFDYDGDGDADILYPEGTGSGSFMTLVRWNGNGFGGSERSSILADQVVDDGDSHLFIDANGDGRQDTLFFSRNSLGEFTSLILTYGVNDYTEGQMSGKIPAPGPANVITRITNGFGAETDISYLPLTDGSVYTRGSGAGGVTWGNGSVVYDLIAPTYVVNEVESTAPAWNLSASGNGGSFDGNAKSKIQYHYAAARVQGGGRGFLGFSEIITYDPQSGVRTATRYRQDFPYIGLPADTSQSVTGTWPDTGSHCGACAPADWSADLSATTTTARSGVPGTLISYAINRYGQHQPFAGKISYFPHLEKSLEYGYTLGGTRSRRVLTTNSYSAPYGNLDSVSIQTFDGGTGSQALATQTTVNTYDNIESANVWHLDRLRSSQVTHARPGVTSVVRESAFRYDTITGILDQEVIEPNGAADETLTTTYVLDAFGNRIKQTTVAAGETPRTTDWVYDPDGRFVNQTKNGLGQTVEQITSRDAFGNPLAVSDINGVLAEFRYDAMGRAHFQKSATGAWSKTTYRICTEFTGLESFNDCPSEGAYRVLTEGGGVPVSQQFFDALGRVIRTKTVSFDGTSWTANRQHYDALGRPVRTVVPHYQGETTLHKSYVQYDQLGRPVMTTAPEGSQSLVAYDIALSCDGVNYDSFTTRTTNALGQDQIEVRNALGELVCVQDELGGTIAYQYDATGNLTHTTGADGFTTLISYDRLGRKIAMDDPDKGDWSYAYNAFGELIAQRDAKNQAIVFTFDVLGRTLQRDDLTGVTDVNNPIGTLVNRATWTYNNAADGTPQAGRGQLAQQHYRTGSAGPILHQQDMSYDGFGRPTQVQTTIEGEVFTESTTYDQYGRVFQTFDASGDSRGLRYVYNNRGYLHQVKEARDGALAKVYQEIQSLDARGKPTQVLLGNAVTAYATYDPQTGRLKDTSAYDTFGAQLQQLDYVFDFLGNLTQRRDLSGGGDRTEDFTYDGLNRLTYVRLTDPDTGVSSGITRYLSYDASGNIQHRSNLGDYEYAGAQPHAVTRTHWSGTTKATYTYDANGNQTSGDGRSLTYSVYDKLLTATKGANDAEFKYGIDRSRYQRIDRTNGNVEKTTTYLGGVEKVVTPTETYYKRYIAGVAIQTIYPNTQVERTEYLLKDHLGSMHTVMDEVGQILFRLHFDAHGNRKEAGNWQQSATTANILLYNDLTPRGFTGHEHVDNLGLIHMNGRIYDPKLGRFLQADPFVQAPTNTQSLNRYTYVFNNPLSYTDPSGFISLRDAVTVVAAVAVAVYLGPWAVKALGPVWGAALTGAAVGATTGAIQTGTLKGTVKGAFYGGLSGLGAGLGGWIGAGLVGGGISEANGGRFGHGFLAAGISHLAGVKMSGWGTWQQFAGRAIVGGTTSRVSGGRFSNGAVTAAFSYVVNLAIEKVNANRVTNDGSSQEEQDIILNKRLRKKLELQKSPDDHFTGFRLRGVTMSHDPSIDSEIAQQYVDTIEDEWFFYEDRVLSNVKIELIGVADSLTTSKADIHLSPCTPEICTTGLGAAAAGGREIWYSPDQHADTPAHEFGHILGFRRNLGPGTGRIMGPPPRSVTPGDVRQLFDAYWQNP